MPLRKRNRYVITYGKRGTEQYDGRYELNPGIGEEANEGDLATPYLLQGKPYQNNRSLICRTNPLPTQRRFTVVELYQAVADEPTTPPQTVRTLAGRIDERTCGLIRGWVDGGKNVPGKVRIYDITTASTVGYATANYPRPDVATQRNSGSFNTFEFRWLVPAELQAGQQHFAFYIEDTEYQCSFGEDVPATMSGCGGPGGDYIIQELIDGPLFVNEGSDKTYVWWVRERHSQQEDQIRTGLTSYEFDPPVPGLQLELIENNSQLKAHLPQGSINQDMVSVLKATHAGRTVPLTQNVQFINYECVRPTDSYQSVSLIWNFADPNANAFEFTSLAQAVAVMSAHFAYQRPGNYGNFPSQMVDFNVGTTAYYKLDGSCQTDKDGFYYVTDLSGNDTIKLAIQVAGGKIVDSLPVPTNSPIISAADWRWVRVAPGPDGGNRIYLYIATLYGADGVRVGWTIQNDPTPRQNTNAHAISADPNGHQWGFDLNWFAGAVVTIYLAALKGGTAYNEVSVTLTVPTGATQPRSELYPNTVYPS